MDRDFNLSERIVEIGEYIHSIFPSDSPFYDEYIGLFDAQLSFLVMSVVAF